MFVSFCVRRNTLVYQEFEYEIKFECKYLENGQRIFDFCLTENKLLTKINSSINFFVPYSGLKLSKLVFISYSENKN